MRIKGEYVMATGSDKVDIVQPFEKMVGREKIKGEWENKCLQNVMFSGITGVAELVLLL